MELFVVKLSQTGGPHGQRRRRHQPLMGCDPTMWPATDMQSVSSYSAGRVLDDDHDGTEYYQLAVMRVGTASTSIREEPDKKAESM